LQQEAAAAAVGEAVPAAAQRCPHCGGQLVVVEVWPHPRAGEIPAAPTVAAAVVDTS